MTNRRLVYSSDRGRLCAGCGWPLDSCRCSKKEEAQAVPARVTAKLRIEKKGRSGKTVTIVDGLPAHAVFVEALAKELKKACGVGGSVAEGAIELQGDQRERVRDLLTKKNFVVRG